MEEKPESCINILCEKVEEEERGETWSLYLGCEECPGNAEAIPEKQMRGGIKGKKGSLRRQHQADLCHVFSLAQYSDY